MQKVKGKKKKLKSNGKNLKLVEKTTTHIAEEIQCLPYAGFVILALIFLADKWIMNVFADIFVFALTRNIIFASPLFFNHFGFDLNLNFALLSSIRVNFLCKGLRT